MTTVRVQPADFDPGDELEALQEAVGAATGAVTSFLGIVRGTGGVARMTLEHYPEMTERELTRLAAEASQRWQLDAVRIVHRHGDLAVGDRIVFVAVAAPHRSSAFEACEFLVDRLKTEAPFWKCEHTDAGPRWVAAREEDAEAARRWTPQSG